MSTKCHILATSQEMRLTHPYADFKVHINGISYMIDSNNNLIRPESGFSPSGFCNVGIVSTFEEITAAPQSILGQPFLRSVYLYVPFEIRHLCQLPRISFSAYRYPTDSCPGYFGFAFPQGCQSNASRDLAKAHIDPNAEFSVFSFHTADFYADNPTSART